MKFFERLRALRTAAELTQEGLALKCGWNGQSRIANYEADPAKSKKTAREPEIDVLPVLARALGVPTGALVDDLDFDAALHSAQPSRFVRADLENILAAVGELIRYKKPVTAETFERAYAYVIKQRRDAKVIGLKEKRAGSDGAHTGRDSRVGADSGGASRARKKRPA